MFPFFLVKIYVLFKSTYVLYQADGDTCIFNIQIHVGVIILIFLCVSIFHGSEPYTEIALSLKWCHK